MGACLPGKFELENQYSEIEFGIISDLYPFAYSTCDDYIQLAIYSINFIELFLVGKIMK